MCCIAHGICRKKKKKEERRRSMPLLVAIPIFDHMTMLDAIGPYEVLHRVPNVEVVFVGDKAGGLYTADDGRLKLQAAACFDDVPKPDVVVVPGGPPLKLPLNKPNAVLDWIDKVHKTTSYTTSVCTGALILGAAGILQGVTATTHWLATAELEAYGATYTHERYIKQGKVITAAGVSSGIDMGLYLAHLLSGDEKIAKAVQLMVEYDPKPPFDAGSVEKAGPEIAEIAKNDLIV